jgi:hypothetical protein
MCTNESNQLERTDNYTRRPQYANNAATLTSVMESPMVGTLTVIFSSSLGVGEKIDRQEPFVVVTLRHKCRLPLVARDAIIFHSFQKRKTTPVSNFSTLMVWRQSVSCRYCCCGTLMDVMAKAPRRLLFAGNRQLPPTLLPSVLYSNAKWRNQGVMDRMLFR